jgi:hypothetical protein
MSKEENENWVAISSEELATLEPGAPVVTFTVEWKAGKRLTHFQESKFISYSPGRGMVTVESRRDWESETLVCDLNVGRWKVVAIETMHEISGWDA